MKKESLYSPRAMAVGITTATEILKKTLVPLTERMEKVEKQLEKVEKMAGPPCIPPTTAKGNFPDDLGEVIWGHAGLKYPTIDNACYGCADVKVCINLRLPKMHSFETGKPRCYVEKPKPKKCGTCAFRINPGITSDACYRYYEGRGAYLVYADKEACEKYEEAQ